jgi:coenzyme F420-reducing hydrogenase beta subunit
LEKNPLIPINVRDVKGKDITHPSILCALNVVGQERQKFWIEVVFMKTLGNNKGGDNITFKILLIGGDFVNKGSEAMILSTKRLLDKYFINTEITLATYKKKNIGSENYPGISIVENSWLKGKTILLAKGVMPFIGGKAIKRYKDADIIINIGGFSVGDKQTLQGNIVYCIEILLSKLANTPFVIFPQDTGSFKTVSRKVLMKMFLPHAELIIVRSEKSKKYLDDIGIKNVYITPDLAFNFKSKVGYDVKKPLVGIIPNMRIYERIDEYVGIMSGLADHICDNFNTNIIFLPHEFEVDRKDDQFVIEQIIDKIRNKNKVSTIKEELAADELKNIIGKLDILITSRFHGAVAGLSLCVPTLVIGWAHKYKELMGLAGQERFVVDFEDINTDNIIDKTEDLWDHKERIRKELKVAVPKIKKDAEQPALLLKALLTREVGTFKSVYVGYSKNKDIHASGQSGGSISALLIYMLEKNMIDGAIVVRWNKTDCLRPEMFIAKTKEEILEASKSKYCPVNMKDIFNELRHTKGNFAFVGVPCQLKALKMLEGGNDFQANILFYFGLYCDRVLSFKFQDYIFSLSRVNKKDVEKFTYRSKEWRGYPGDMQIRLKNNTIKNIPKEYRMKVKSLFTPDRCWKCNDKTNKSSDISFGDAWFPEFKKDKLGTSLIVSRTEMGENLLKKAEKNGIIKLDEIDSSKIKQKTKKKSCVRYIVEQIRLIYYVLKGVDEN